MDTEESSLTGSAWAPPPPPPPTRARVSKWVVILAILGMLLASGIVVARYVRLPYDSLGPGEASSVSRAVQVSGHPTFPPKGELFSTTVAVRERVNPFEALAGWLDPDTDVIAEQRIVGGMTPRDYQKLNVVAMADSKTTARILALRHLGFDDVVEGSEILGVEPGFPASDLLRTGDVIVGVDGTTAPDPAVVVDKIQARKAGDVLRLTIRRGTDPARDVDTPLGAEQGRTILGVRMTAKIHLPFEIDIDSGDVVGPSAGLAYALELVDLLTPGELTGGARVAVTGDLSPDGKVGPIGGVAQKAATVRNAGIEVFLVPRANLAEARRHSHGLDIRPVDSFDDALVVLAGLKGSNALALGRPGAPT